MSYGICHPANSRVINCACGHKTEWMKGRYFQACVKCHQVHQRGKKGPTKNPRSCKGAGHKVKFLEAVRLALDEFVRAMYQMGFEVSRNGRYEVIDHAAAKRSKYKDLTVKIAEHFNHNDGATL